LTKMEHHSNLVPWQQIAMQKGLKLKFLGLDEKGRLDISGAEKIISDKTAIVGAIHASNITGYINPVKELAEISHEHNALFVLDGAQSVPHFPVNVKKLDCDFLAFSGHKMLAPAGIGGLYGKRELLEKMEPFLYGGDMIFEVWLEKSTWNKLPWKFEAGTPAIADGIGLGSAIDYLEKIGMENVRTWEKKLVDKTFGEMRGIGEIEIYGENEKERGGVIAFNVKGLHPHDVATILDREGIAIRSGEHCAQPYMRELGIEAGTARASFYIYNTPEEIELLCAGIAKAKKLVS
ncbi:MAG: cysteine desulfurase, partial [archaeon]